MVTGPAEAFTPEQLAELYDTNVLGTQRLNRAALPKLREQQDGLLLWVGSSSTRGGTPPYLAPYFAAKAAMDALAQSYALEVARFGIESTIVVPGAFTHGTNHFAHSGSPADADVVAAYETKYAGLMEQVSQKLRRARAGVGRRGRGGEGDRDRGRHREGQAAVPGAHRSVRRRRGRGQRGRRPGPRPSSSAGSASRTCCHPTA